MSNVLAFPNRRVAPVERPIADEHVETPPAPPVIESRVPIPKVALPLPVVERMLNALAFYAQAGFDHGRAARGALGEFNPQPQPQESA
ncbi:hypothetical protein N5B55_04790 [Ralstonia pickettii]|uniref:hypothetical protein n=1 Tax=Ralstonia pickettii TaxID=329 RepID=UPI0027152C74|nr:hypothetical protein [Ralstonia pickettii]WKZ86270.1 hypothetical protein N5B55_04790 [Ralstonia pickettii]